MQTLKTTSLIALLFVCLLLSACESTPASSENGSLVAEVDGERLTREQLANLLPQGLSKKDSIELSVQFIDKWIAEVAFYKEATTKLDEDMSAVEQDVATYRRTLINHLYETRLVEANLDTVVGREEAEAYYNAHQENFILSQNLVKVYYIKVPVQSPALSKMKKLIGSQKPADKTDLTNLCIQNAESYFINDSTWLFMEDLRNEVPGLKDQPDVSLFKGRVFEFTDEAYYYYINIRDVKARNSLSPFNFEFAGIRKMILNNRKAELIRNYKNELLARYKSKQSTTDSSSVK